MEPGAHWNRTEAETSSKIPAIIPHYMESTSRSNHAIKTIQDNPRRWLLLRLQLRIQRSAQYCFLRGNS